MRRFIDGYSVFLSLVDFIDRAALRILFYFVSMVHHIGNIDGHQDYKERHAIRKSGENRYPCDALGYAYREWLGDTGAIACRYRAEKDAQRRQRVKAQRQCRTDYQRCESQVFFVAACQSREGSKRHHEHRDHQDAVASHFFDQRRKPCYDGAGLGQNPQRATYHEKEGNDADAAFEAFIDGGEEIQKSRGILCHIVEGGWIYDHLSGIYIFDTLIHPCRDHIAGDGAQNDDAHQNQNRARCLKCFYIFFHERNFSPFTSFLQNGRLP